MTHRSIRITDATHTRLSALAKTLSDRASERGRVRVEVTLGSVVEAAIDALEASLKVEAGR